MTQYTNDRLDMLVRVETYIETHADEFTEGSLGRTLCDSLRAELGSIENIGEKTILGQNQSRASVTQKRNARDRLLTIMRQVRDAANALEPLHEGITDQFALSVNASEQLLLSQARAFVTTSQTLQHELIRCGLKSDFLESLTAAEASYRELVETKHQRVGDRIRGNAGLKAKVRLAAALVQRLDRVMRIHLAERPEALAEWSRTKRIRQTGKGAEKVAANG